MNKRFVALSVLVVALAAGSAHASNPNPTTDCDTWNRAGTTQPYGQPSYMESGSGDINNLHEVLFALPSTPLPVDIHPNGNNVVVRNAVSSTDPSKVTYVQVVGGGQYTGDAHTPKAGEGGFEQARVYDPTTGTTITFHNDLFGPIRESNPNFWQTSTDTCVSVTSSNLPTPNHNEKVDTGRIAADCNGLPNCGY